MAKNTMYIFEIRHRYTISTSEHTAADLAPFLYVHYNNNNRYVYASGYYKISSTPTQICCCYILFYRTWNSEMSISFRYGFRVVDTTKNYTIDAPTNEAYNYYKISLTST